MPGHPLTDGPIEDILSDTGPLPAPCWNGSPDRARCSGNAGGGRSAWRRPQCGVSLTKPAATPRLETLAAVLDALGVLTTNRPETELTRAVAEAAHAWIDRPVNPTDIG